MINKNKKKKQQQQQVENNRIKGLLSRIYKFYLVGITGRTSFILENMDSVKFKITIGNDLKCSCNQNSKHCIHTLYVLTQIFYIPVDNSLLFKNTYTDKELRYIIASRIIHSNKIADFLKNIKKRAPRKIIMEEDEEDDENETICAICQMEIVKQDPIATCQSECQNVFHLECFTQWAKHEFSKKGIIKCPLCRDRKPAEYLRELKQKQFEHIESKNNQKVGKEFFYYCDGCQLREIHANEAVYKCMFCEDVTLCATCFNFGKHIKHSFIVKPGGEKKWYECEDRKGKKKLDEEQGLIKMKLPNHRRLYHFLAASLPCYFSKNTRWNIVECKKLDIKIEELECIMCNDKKKAFLRRLPCGHFIHHRCLRRRIQKGKLFCKLDGQHFLLGYHSLLKHEKLNKNVEVLDEEQSEEEQKEKYSLSKSVRSDTRSSQSPRKIRSVKSVKGKDHSFLGHSGLRRSNNPEWSIE